MTARAATVLLAVPDFASAVEWARKGAWMPSIADEVATVTRTAWAHLLALDRYLLVARSVAMSFIIVVWWRQVVPETVADAVFRLLARSAAQFFRKVRLGHEHERLALAILFHQPGLDQSQQVGARRLIRRIVRVAVDFDGEGLVGVFQCVEQ